MGLEFMLRPRILRRDGFLGYLRERLLFLQIIVNLKSQDAHDG